MKSTIYFAVARFVIAVTLLASGTSKISNPFRFLMNVYDYEIFSEQGGWVVAIFLPWVELLLGAVLLLDILAEGALLITLLMGLAFVAVQLWAIGSGLDISCGCFQGLNSEIRVGPATLLPGVTLILISAVGLSLKRSANNTSQNTEK